MAEPTVMVTLSLGERQPLASVAVTAYVVVVAGETPGPAGLQVKTVAPVPPVDAAVKVTEPPLQIAASGMAVTTKGGGPFTVIAVSTTQPAPSLTVMVYVPAVRPLMVLVVWPPGLQSTSTGATPPPTVTPAVPSVPPLHATSELPNVNARGKLGALSVTLAVPAHALGDETSTL
jgi:hypothetical protein